MWAVNKRNNATDVTETACKKKCEKSDEVGNLEKKLRENEGQD